MLYLFIKGDYIYVILETKYGTYLLFFNLYFIYGVVHVKAG